MTNLGATFATLIRRAAETCFRYFCGRCRTETEWVAEARAKIFNARYESAAHQRKTITLFSSNFVPERGEDWFADRIRDGRFTVVEVTGPSMRPLMEAE